MKTKPSKSLVLLCLLMTLVLLSAVWAAILVDLRSRRYVGQQRQLPRLVVEEDSSLVLQAADGELRLSGPILRRGLSLLGRAEALLPLGPRVTALALLTGLDTAQRYLHPPGEKIFVQSHAFPNGEACWVSAST